MRHPCSGPTFWLALVFIAALCTPAPAEAQERKGDLGLGVHLGDPTGLSARIYGRTRYALDVLAAWDLDDDYLLLNVHALRERRLRDSPLNVFYGPGAFFGIEERKGNEEPLIGLSATGGINYYVERFEVFLQLTPRLGLLPAVTFDLGGGGGLRYYL